MAIRAIGEKVLAGTRGNPDFPDPQVWKFSNRRSTSSASPSRLKPKAAPWRRPSGTMRAGWRNPWRSVQSRARLAASPCRKSGSHSPFAAKVPAERSQPAFEKRRWRANRNRGGIQSTGSRNGAASEGHSKPAAAWIVAAITTLVFASLTIVRFREKPAAASPEMRLEINTPSTPAPLNFALSPDGQHSVFAASGDGPQRLWLRSLD